MKPRVRWGVVGGAFALYAALSVAMQYEPRPRPMTAEEQALLAGHRLMRKSTRRNDRGQVFDTYVFTPTTSRCNAELIEHLRAKGYTVKRMDFPGDGATREGSKAHFCIPRSGFDIGVGKDNVRLEIQAEPSIGEKMWSSIVH